MSRGLVGAGRLPPLWRREAADQDIQPVARQFQGDFSEGHYCECGPAANAISPVTPVSNSADRWYVPHNRRQLEITFGRQTLQASGLAMVVLITT